MSTKYRNSASVAQERVLQLSSQWNHSLSASGSNNDSGDSNSSGKLKPGKGLNNYSHTKQSSGAPEWEDTSNDSRTHSQKINAMEKQKKVPSTYAAEEDANLNNPDAEWKSGYAHSDSARGGKGAGDEDEKAKKTQPAGGRAEKYAREEDDSLSPQDTGAPTKDARKSGRE